MHRHVWQMMTSGLSAASAASFLASECDGSGARRPIPAATSRDCSVVKPSEAEAKPEFAAGMSRHLAKTEAG